MSIVDWSFVHTFDGVPLANPPSAWHFPRVPGIYVVKSAFDNPIGYDVVRIDEEQLESGALPSIAYGPIPEQKP